MQVRFVGAPPGHGACTAGYTVTVAWSPAALAVAVTEHPHRGGNGVGVGVGYARQVATRLPAPLGNRVVVDAASRAAVPVTGASTTG